MVDSGQQVTAGTPSSDAVYRDMVLAALARPPQAELALSCRRDGERLAAEVTVTNTSTATLSLANDATVHLLAYEQARVLWTDRFVRGGAALTIDPPLAPDETRTFSLETGDLQVTDWAKVRTVALMDYRPGGTTGAYDMLQAVQGTCGLPDPIGSIALPLVLRTS